MEWITAKDNEVACEITDNIYLFVKREKKSYGFFAKYMGEDKEFTVLTGIITYREKNLHRVYGIRSTFYKDLRDSIEALGIDIDPKFLQKCLSTAIQDIQLGEVTIEDSAPKVRQGEVDDEKYVLDMDADVMGTFKPSDVIFESPSSYTILEPCWLPYTHIENGETLLYPSLLVKTAKTISVLRYKEGIKIGDNFVRGAFPSPELKTLISMPGIKKSMDATMDTVEEALEEIDVEIDEALTKHSSLTPIKKLLMKRWIQGTYFFQIMDAFPILNIMGPSESGKTRLGLVVTSIGYHGEPTLDLTEAGIFRAKEELKPTMVVDEAEYLSHPDEHKKIKLLLNASYSKGLGVVHRYDDVGGTRVRMAFNLYSPFVIIAINPLIGITSSRSIAINMVRTDKDMPKANEYMYRSLRDKLYMVKLFMSGRVWETYHTLDISEYVTARFDELFRPLFTLTRLFGTEEEYKQIGEWAKRYQTNFRISAENVTKERDFLIVLHDMISTESKHAEYNGEEYVLLKEIATEMSFIYGGKYKSSTVSSLLRALGFDDRRRNSQGLTMARTPLPLVEVVMHTYGIDVVLKEERDDDVIIDEREFS